MSPTLGLIDYGMGNLHSVEKAFERLGRRCNKVQHPADLKAIDALILPGVGSFDPAMANLTATGLVPDLKAWGAADRPLLGICLGLQLLFEASDEGSKPGLGLLQGQVQRLPADAGERIPHMGWAPLQKQNDCPLLDRADPPGWVYFVHSYAAIPETSGDLKATTAFGDRQVTAMVWRGRISACQFHPEKSATSGERILSRWLNWLDEGAPSLP